MADQIPEPERWLTLSQASRELGVHITTLRRWADNGDIPVMLTPGGHRRFSSRDVNQFAQKRRLLKTDSLEKALVDKALTQTRQEIVVRQNQTWITSFDEATRTKYRVLGRYLLGLTLQFMSNEDGSDILREAANIGRQYGEIGLENNLPLTGALEATMFFRDMLLETAFQLPENVRIRPDANLRVMQQINTLLNTVQLAVAEVYDAHSSNSLSRP